MRRRTNLLVSRDVCTLTCSYGKALSCVRMGLECLLEVCVCACVRAYVCVWCVRV